MIARWAKGWGQGPCQLHAHIHPEQKKGGSEMLWEGLRTPQARDKMAFGGLEELWQTATILVKEPTAALSATVAGQLVAGILDGELVVIGELLAT